MVNSPPIFAPTAVHTVTLFIPDLFWPHAGVTHDAPRVPGLCTLMGRADVSDGHCDDAQAWLCEQFGVTRQIDWPVAPIALLGAGSQPAEQFWLCADPVHLRVNRDQLILLPPEALSITQGQAEALCTALNRHFATDGLTFVAPEPSHWYLKPAHPARIRTHSLARAAAHDVDGLLPEGEDGLAWHRTLNEIQMVLHAHPVNEERSQQGALPINSLWFSGGGVLPCARCSFQAVIGSSALAQGLSSLAGVPFADAGRGVGALGADHVLVELREASTGAMRMEPGAWKAGLEHLENTWIAPLTHMLRKRLIRGLVLATVHDGHAYRWSVSPMNLLWRWWRGGASLAIPPHGP